jgi:hypothetical protein
MFLVVEEGVWRDVEEVNVGDVVDAAVELARHCQETLDLAA